MECLKNFNWVQYLSNNPDLVNAGITTSSKAWKHFVKFGKKEGRSYYEIQPSKVLTLSSISGTRHKITIITPCSRPYNLKKIYDTLKFEFINKWIIVYDESKVKKEFLFEEHLQIDEYYHKGEGISGNPQRNYALDLNLDGYIYFLDDDNLIHPDLYKLLDNTLDIKIYTFSQVRTYGKLVGNYINGGEIDTAMILVHSSFIKNIKWKIDEYGADFYFIKEIIEKNKENWIFINNIVCYYNGIFKKL